jgi:hypothetical protein
MIEYDALSYAWGTTMSSRRALIDGIPISVAESLNLEFRRLRSHNRFHTLWIDALCINQQDVRERSYRFEHMTTVYSTARHIVIWLGEWPALATCPHSDASWNYFWANDLHSAKASHDQNQNEHMVQRLVEFCYYSWHRRLWVNQEFVLARSDLIVLLGSLLVGWDSFWNTLLLDQTFDLGLSLQASLEAEISVIYLDALRACRPEPRPLHWYLTLSQHAVATDPRDKIFGILGIAKSRNIKSIRTDYSRTVQQVLTEAIVACILDGSAFTYFDFALNPPQGLTKISDMASWVIDFTLHSRPYGSKKCFEGPTTDNTHTLNSVEETVLDRERRLRSVRVSADCRVLYTHGIYVGTIRASQSYPFDLAYDILRNIVGDVFMIQSSSGSSLVEVLCRTGSFKRKSRPLR